MKNSRNDIINSLQQKKENTKQIIITSILIAVGVNSLTTGLVGAFGLDKYAYMLLISGLVLSLGAVAYYLISSVRKLNKKIKFEGFLIYKPKSKELVPIEGYEVSKDMVKYLNAAFVENKALRTLWETDSISNFKFIGRKPGANTTSISSESEALLIELIEYCLVEQLSLHLSAYFNNSDLKQVEEISRNDIPDILLDNRFLKLFSEDMQNRELFVEDYKKDGTQKFGKVVMAYNSGAIYNHFDLILPRNSNVKRLNKNRIAIETNMFSISIGILFNGFGTVLPKRFEEHYLGIYNYRDIAEYKFNIELSIKFKVRSLLFSNNWRYYSWADDFIERLNDYLSKERFFEKINWSTIGALLQCKYIEAKFRDNK